MMLLGSRDEKETASPVVHEFQKTYSTFNSLITVLHYLQNIFKLQALKSHA